MKIPDLVKVIKDEYIYLYYRGLKLEIDDTNLLYNNPALKEKEIDFIMIETNPKAIAIYISD